MAAGGQKVGGLPRVDPKLGHMAVNIEWNPSCVLARILGRTLAAAAESQVRMEEAIDLLPVISTNTYSLPNIKFKHLNMILCKLSFRIKCQNSLAPICLH